MILSISARAQPAISRSLIVLGLGIGLLELVDLRTPLPGTFWNNSAPAAFSISVAASENG